MSVNAPSVFIVDDDASFLVSVERLFRASGFSVKTFSSATEFLNQCPFDGAGCVVVDLQMPGMSGMELQAAMIERENPLPIIFLTAQGDIATSVVAMRQGAEDFLTKLSPKEELLAAVKRALARSNCEREKRAHRRELRERFDTLTPREREVLAYVLRGQLNKQTAADLRIDVRSVKRHRTSLMSKLQVHSVAELVRLAHDAKWESDWCS